MIRLNKPNKSKKERQFINIFNRLSSNWEAIVNKRDTEREVGFIRTALSERARTLDLCCGTARHSIVLSKKGWDVIGMDLSKNLLSIAKLRTKQANVKVPLVRADMRHIPFRSQAVTNIINMFTSFGYLPSKSEDMKSLLEIHRTLEENGKFLLDLANRDHLVRNFQERDWAEFEPFYLLERRSLDPEDSKLTSNWILIKKDTGSVKSIKHEVRLYAFNRIRQMLKDAGFMVKEVYGGYEKQEFNIDASRMIILSQKRRKSHLLR